MAGESENTNAIWYTKNQTWMIGEVFDLGSSAGFIATKDKSDKLVDDKNEWKYGSDNGWNDAQREDIQVQGNCKYIASFFEVQKFVI